MSHRIASQRAFEVLDPQNEALMGWETWSELLMEVDPSLDMTQIRSLPMPYTHPRAQKRAHAPAQRMQLHVLAAPRSRNATVRGTVRVL
jgi:hypothetical protein